MKTFTFQLLLATFFAVSGRVVPLRAQLSAPTVIDQVPYVITQSGNYVLARSFNYDPGDNDLHTLIDIQASNVTLDFANHYLAGPISNPSQNVTGILANERSNLTIKNGTIAFCAKGIFILGNGQADTNNVNHRIENLRVTYCTLLGISVDGAPSSRVDSCQVSHIGGNTLPGYTGFAKGIIINNAGAKVSNCQVTDVFGTQGVFGIFAGSAGGVMVGNVVGNCPQGLAYGKYQNNLTYNCPVPFSGGIDAGGNN